MTGFIKCFIYFSLIGVSSFFVGLSFPRSHFDGSKFPYRSFKWERDGKIYDKLKIRAWKGKMPDMSKIVKCIFPKKIKGKANLEELERLIAETCVAECVHNLLIVCGIPAFFIWRGIGGLIVFLLWFLGNAVFIIIQRYNRPQIRRLCDKLERALARRGAELKNESLRK